MFQLPDFTAHEMVLCRAGLKEAAQGAASMEEAADRLVGFLYDELGDDGDARAAVLVRLYKTHPFGDLPADLQEFAKRVVGGAEATPESRCLTLLASRGVEEAWCSRHRSRDHRAIPLPSARTVRRFPMIAQLIDQLGVDIGVVVSPDPGLLVDQHRRNFNVFHVPQAAGDPNIPAQEDFVAPYEVASALGFGGLLPNGDLFAVVLFTRVAIGRDTAELFRPLALTTKLALLPFAGGPVFQPAAGAGSAS
jgi:two-component system, NtrC family, sensor kinase